MMKSWVTPSYCSFWNINFGTLPLSFVFGDVNLLLSPGWCQETTMVNIKFSSFIFTSLDGFIAREDGSLDWLPGADPLPSKNNNNDDDETKDTTIEDEDYGFESFLSSVDAFLMGQKTYEFIKNSNAPWPYKDRKVYVLSTTYTKEKDIPGRHKDKLILVQGESHEVCKRMEADNVQQVYIDGGSTFQQYYDLHQMKNAERSYYLQSLHKCTEVNGYK